MQMTDPVVGEPVTMQLSKLHHVPLQEAILVSVR